MLAIFFIIMFISMLLPNKQSAEVVPGNFSVGAVLHFGKSIRLWLRSKFAVLPGSITSAR